MNKELTPPVLDIEVLQQKSQEAAMKAALNVIDEYYNSYSSPYKKQLNEYFENKGASFSFEIPDIIAAINKNLSLEVDVIANTAISKTFIPLMKKFLTRAEPKMFLSDILKLFIEKTRDNFDDYSMELNKNSSYDWYNLIVRCEDRSYEITLHETHNSKNEDVKKYSIFSLPSSPRNDKYSKEVMKMSLDGVSLELPFTKDIIQDEFMSFIAKLIIAKTEIIFDCDDFDENWFPHDCHC